MRRRFIDVGKLKRLPSRKSRVAEPVPTNSYLHWKLLMGGVLLVLFDSLMNFRLEYLYPVLMFIRSVYDSYKYQGFIFSLLFISLVVYLDLLCWTVLTVPWLFIGASTCVWLEIIRTIDHGFTYSALILGVLFLYMEVSHKIMSLPLNMVNLSRPFAAHCIGYPVVTMSFLIKHQITHIIRQRQQKRVSEENSVFYSILQKALPPPPPVDDADEPLIDEGTSAESSGLTNHIIGNGEAGGGTKRASPKVSSSSNGSTKSSHKSGSSSSSSSSNNSSSSSSTSSVPISSTGNNRHRITNGLKSLIQDPKLLKALSLDVSTPPTSSSSSFISTNGEVSLVGTRPLSASSSNNKVHLPTGKKQAMVKAVPRTDQSSSTTSDLEQKMQKTKQAMELMNVDLKDERQAKLELQATKSQLELEIKKLKADLHASCLQEEETTSRVENLQNLEKSHKQELQRLKNENDNFQNKLSKIMTSKQQDQTTIAELEKKLKSESDTRMRVESELREYQHASRNSYSAEEVKQLNDKLRKVERDLESTRKELIKTGKSCESLKKELSNQHILYRAIEGERHQLKIALADETRVKIELFTALSEAGRKQQTLIDECHRKNLEISRLKQHLAEIMAIMPSHHPPSSPPHMSPPTTSTTSVGGIPGGYPPASSPQR